MKKLLPGMVLWAVMSATSALVAGSDELLELTTRMDMPGMAMPAVAQTVSLHKGEACKPGKVPHQKHCEMSDLKVSGNKTEDA